MKTKAKQELNRPKVRGQEQLEPLKRGKAP